MYSKKLEDETTAIQLQFCPAAVKVGEAPHLLLPSWWRGIRLGKC